MAERVAWWWTDSAAGRSARYAWLASTALIIALSGYQLVALPRAIDRLWENLVPWLANSDEEIASLKAQTRPLLARFFGFFFGSSAAD